MGTKNPQREIPGKRLVISLLRAAHLVGVAGVGAGVLAAWPFPQWQVYAFTLLGSGLGILLLDWWSNPRHLAQVNGLFVLTKLAMMGWFVSQAGQREWIFWLILVCSALVAHAPASLRHRDLFARR
ncbi:MAG: hypothetical protein Q8L56_00095 [Rhodocyclaceae bacterium]|nr:hypothetical protein [Rhodocyclaceae bacterium]